MTDKILITVEDVAKFRPTSKGIPIERLAPFIKEAQVLDLADVLGDTLFTDFMSKFNVTADSMYQPYQDLLNGKNYTPAGMTSPIEFDGLRPMLVYYSLARFYENNQFNATSFGMVKKNNEFSEPMTAQEIQSAADYMRSAAIVYERRVKKFLNDNVSTYPLFATSNKQENSSLGVKFFDV